MKNKVAWFAFGLVCLWIVVGSVRLVVEHPALLHACLAVLLAGAGAALLWAHTRGDRASLTAFFQRPQSRVGYRLSLGYFVGTSLLFMMFNPNTWQYTLQKSVSASFLAVSSALAVLAAPVYEEYFFRGCLLPTLAQKLEMRMPLHRANLWAVYLSALIFWLFHAPMSALVWQGALAQGALPLSPGSFVLGLACGFVFVRDQSLWFAILLHAFANLLGPVWGGILPPAVMPYFFATL